MNAQMFQRVIEIAEEGNKERIEQFIAGLNGLKDALDKQVSEIPNKKVIIDFCIEYLQTTTNNMKEKK